MAVQVLLNGFDFVLRGPGSLWQVDAGEVMCGRAPWAGRQEHGGETGGGESRGGGALRSHLGGPPGGGGQGPMVDKAKESGSFLTPSEASCGQAHVGHWTSGHK